MKKIMSSLRNSNLSTILASVAIFTAVLSQGKACIYIFHQPDLPKELIR